MADRDYESPTIEVLGELTDLTQVSPKPGIYFDFPGASEGNKNVPPPGAPGTTS